MTLQGTKRFRQKFRQWPMQKKMFCAYTVPTICIIILANAVAFPIISHYYKEELKNTITLTNDQAQNFMLNHAQNMDYIAQLITRNWEIKETLSSPNFGSHQNAGEAYREFYNLNDEFENIELSNDIYRIGIYLPDSLMYANNNYYFYPESELKSRKDYADLLHSLSANQYYFATIREKEYYNPKLTEKYLALFQPLRIITSQGKERLYVVKVEIQLKNLVHILDNASDVMHSSTYLVSASGKEICSSNGAAALNSSEDVPADWSLRTVQHIRCYVFSRQLVRYKWQVLTYIPQKELSHRASVIWILAVILLVGLCSAVAVISYQLSRSYAGRLSLINQRMKHLGDEGTTDRFVLQAGSGDEIDQICHTFNEMAEQLHYSMQERFLLGKKVASANLKALQAQINPHFLYNTLDLINWGAMDYGATEIADLARNLGQFYRLSLNHGKMAILIADELRHVQAYVNIENAHFGGAINLSLQVPDSIRELACLNIILQPLVENAIVHGIAEHPAIVECNITICAVHSENDLLLQVQDDGPGMTAEQMRTILQEEYQSTYNGYGVKNIHSRIRLCYGEAYGISYQSCLGEGTTATIRIPAMHLEELNALLQ
ncbi:MULTISPECIES: sensor histidine kinase [Caproicibacterium]|uniref:Histidine kinase n=1 Tax=Caproicibacterium argilliputei TaxID=3030016 RepID=A0AA97D716_9FIRM|nr:histidine kinase [Caproicibacterium argilliputei]WOC31730.1 histidine kinase [Caproicibacterium argilliputei]